MLDEIENHVTNQLKDDSPAYSDTVFDAARGRHGPVTSGDIDNHHARMHRLGLAAGDFRKHVELARRFDQAVALANQQAERKAKHGQAVQAAAQFRKDNAAVFEEMQRLENIAQQAKADVDQHAGDDMKPDQIRSECTLVFAGQNH